MASEQVLHGVNCSEMRPTLFGRELQETIRFQAAINRASLIIGEPGTGKTQKAKAMAFDPELAAIMGVERIQAFIVPAAQATDESINGFVMGKDVDSKPEVVYALPKYCVDDPVLLIIDEIGKAKDPVRDSLYPWLTGDEAINGHRLHPNSVVILTDNDVTHKAGSRSLNNALKGRVADFDYIPDPNEWIQDFAMPRVQSGVMGIEAVRYIEANSESLNRFDPASKYYGQPCPRKWEDVGKALVAGHSQQAMFRSILSLIGMDEGAKFIDYLKTYRLLPTLDDVASRAHEVVLPDNLDDAYRFAGFLAAILRRRNNPDESALAVGAATLLGRFSESGKTEIAAWVLRESLRKVMAVPGGTLLLNPAVGQTLLGYNTLSNFVSALGKVESAR